MATPDNISKIHLLPLAEHYKAALVIPAVYVVVATARVMQQADYDYLPAQLGKPDYVIARNGDDDTRRDSVLKVAGLRRLFNLCQFASMSKVFFDDNASNLAAVCKLGVRCIAQ